MMSKFYNFECSLLMVVSCFLKILVSFMWYDDEIVLQRTAKWLHL